MLEAAIFQRAANGCQQLLALERLQEIVVGAIADGRQRDGNIVDGGDHHDRHVGIFFLGLFEQADAVEFGHHQVGEHELELFAGVEDSERFQAGTCLFAVDIPPS